MNLGYSKGAISKMLAINILLAVLIGGAVIYLFNKDDKGNTAVLAKSPEPSRITKTPKAAAPNSQAEIDALKHQLESEATKLDTLREEDKLVEALRTESSAEAAIALVAQALGSQSGPAKSDQNKVDKTVGEAPE